MSAEVGTTEEGVEVELIAQARALHAYVPTPSDEDQSLVFLSFQKGELIDVIEMHESGWWEGCCNDTIGLFPGSYVEIVERFLSSKEGATQSESDEKAAADKAAAVSEKSTEAAKEEPKGVEKSAPAKAESAEATPEVSTPAAAAAAAGEGDEPLEEPEEATVLLFEARRFALHFKALLDAKILELQTALEGRAAAEARVTVSVGTEPSGELERLSKELASAQARVETSEAQRKELEGQLATAASSGGADEEVTALKASVASLESQLAAVGTPETSAGDSGELEKVKEERTALQGRVESLEKDLKEAATVSVVAAESNGVDSGELEALNVELKAAKEQRMALQSRVDEMDGELRAALDRATEAEAKTGGEEKGGADVAQLDSLNAELKLAKSQRMDLQKRVDEMDMELRGAMDRATELQQQLDVKESGVTDGELNDTQVLAAELKMAKQQRQALQTRVDDMDFELRQALDSASEAGALQKQVTELEEKLAASGGGGGGEGESGGASSAELEEERTKRTRYENQCKDLKKELEEAKKAGGSSSIMQIKMQAMEKELTKARKALETATAGPAQQIEELTKETKELKDKVRKSESQLDVALNRAAANEEAMQQKLELRAELQELRDQMSAGKPTTEEEKKTPTYKLEKLERENAELREKLAMGKSSLSGNSTPQASPMVARRAPVKKVAAGGNGAPPKKGERIVELETELADREAKIEALEASLKSAKDESDAKIELLETSLQSSKDEAAAVAASPRAPGKLSNRLDGPMTSLQRDLTDSQLTVAKRDREIGDLQSQLQGVMAQLSRSGIDASSGISSDVDPSEAASPRPEAASPRPGGEVVSPRPGPGPGAPIKRAPVGKQPMKKMFIKRKMGPKGGAGAGGVAPKKVPI